MVILPLCLLILEGQLCVSFFHEPAKIPCSGSSSYVDLIGWEAVLLMNNSVLTTFLLFERKRKL